MNLDNLHIVLVETTHPGNIGATARAMKNMGLQRLTLVKPALFPHAEATARAAGGSAILTRARVVESLDAALADCHLVIGTSARRRHLACPALDPRQCAERVSSYSEHSQVALLFGRERTGLTNAELDRCHFIVHIPTHPDYSSLNLAAAVQVLAYEMYMIHSAAQAIPLTRVTAAPATAQEMQLFFEHLQQTLLEIGFLDPTNPRHIMRRLRRLFNRALPDQHEINILRGILTALQLHQNTSRSALESIRSPD